MTKDKTSWLDLDDDDDFGGGGSSGSGGPGAITESIQDDGSGPTFIQPSAPTYGSEGPTTLQPTVEKTQIHLGENFADDADPVTGWLVIVKGKGLGRSIPLGTGMNAIGRDPASAVAFDFGDNKISGQDHLRIIYDDANRVFLVAPGGGRNLSRLDGQIITQTGPIESHSVIDLSPDTSVCFVAFCGAKFDWSELENSES